MFVCVLDLIHQQPLPAPPEGDISLPYDISNMQNYSLAVSGEVFRWIVDYAPADILSKVSSLTPAEGRV